MLCRGWILGAGSSQLLWGGELNEGILYRRFGHAHIAGSGCEGGVETGSACVRYGFASGPIAGHDWMLMVG